jgi:iron complex transport system ATP-binding protein
MAMALAQETPVMILDEPTTFLDLAAQIDLLDLAWALNRAEGRTIVMVLHDLNMAARYADHLIAMRGGMVMATGTPAEVITPGMLREVFEIEATVLPDPVTGAPMVLPERALSPEGEITPETPIDDLVVDSPPELVVA